MKKYEDKIEQIENILNSLDLDELIICCSCLDGDNAIYPMDDFNDILCGIEPWDIARAAYYGEFYPTDNYFRFNVYGNLESANNPVREGWIPLGDLAAYAIDYNESFGVNEIRTLLDQWEEEEEKSQID